MVRRCGRRADLFVRFLETNTAPEGLFTEDVFLDLTLPQWRLQTYGRDAWHCRELMRGDIRDGALGEVSVYCTGDWSPDIQAAHTREVTLLRP